MIDFDAAATTPVRREAMRAMWPFLAEEYGNPSSTHDMGLATARALDEARAGLAKLVGVHKTGIIFTSGGTESVNLAIKGLALAEPRGRHILVSAIEHMSVLNSADYLRRIHGFDVEHLPVTAEGQLLPETLDAALRPDTTLVSVQYANNEVGTVQDMATLSALVHDTGALLHTDAIQAAGWLPLQLAALGVDALSLSGHKFGAPKGIGLLAMNSRVRLEPLIHGGGQENENRSGTQNVAGAVALFAAAALADSERTESAASIAALRDRLINAVKRVEGSAVLTGHPSHRLPGIASFVFPGTAGESVLLGLEERDILVSSGSACAAGSTDPSHVLRALGFADEIAHTAVRFSLSHGTTKHDVDTATTALVETLTALRRLSSHEMAHVAGSDG